MTIWTTSAHYVIFDKYFVSFGATTEKYTLSPQAGKCILLLIDLLEYREVGAY